MDVDFDLNIDIDIDIDSKEVSTSRFKSRYIKPKNWKGLKERQIKYKNAEKLSKEIIVTENERAFVIIDGSFILGDFIEAFIVDRNLHIKNMYISTLSLSCENVDSIKNLIEGNYVDKLTLLVSDYFYSHERHELIPYIYKTLDNGDFQLVVARSHTKICGFETIEGKKCVIHGSANLRSSDNIEQIVIEQSKELYDFNLQWIEKLAEKYNTINKNIKKPKSLRGDLVWNTIN